MAKKIKNDSLLYRSLYVKIQNDIAGGNDCLEDSFKILKSLSAPKTKYLAGYFQQKGAFFQNKNKDSSYFYHQEAKNLYLKLNDSLRTGYNLLMLAEIQMASSDYNEVQSLATEALSYLKNQKNSVYISQLYNLLAWSYRKLGDYEKAIENFKKSIEFSDTSLNKKIIENNIGLIFQESKNYPKAIAIFSKLGNDPILDEDLKSKARIIDNLGYALFLNSNPEGVQHMMRSLKIKDSIHDDYGLLASHLHLSESYLKSNSPLAKSHAKKAFALAEKLNNADDKLESIKLLSKTTTAKIESDQLFSDYIALNDSIKVVRQKAKNQFAKIKYDSRQAEEEALRSKADSAENKLVAEKAENRNLIAGIFIAFLFITGILLYQLLKLRHVKEKVKVVYNTETRISKKVHDELANDVYNIMNFATNHDIQNAAKKESLLNSLESIYNRTRDISRENSPIDLGKNYPLQLAEMLSEYHNEFLNVIITGNETINWDILGEDKKMAAYRILQELMVNMKKHSGATLVLIKFENKNKSIHINYSDNGTGFKAAGTFFKNGLQNVENRILGIHGTITFDKHTNKGVKILIAFPS